SVSRCPRLNTSFTTLLRALRLLHTASAPIVTGHRAATPMAAAACLPIQARCYGRPILAMLTWVNATRTPAADVVHTARHSHGTCAKAMTAGAIGRVRSHAGAWERSAGA